MADREWRERVPQGNPIAIAEVELSREGELRVHPNIPEPQCYEFIWRAAMGVRWSNECRALVPYEVGEKSPTWWFFQIRDAVACEYGQTLELAGGTKWTNVPPAVRSEIERGVIPDAG